MQSKAALIQLVTAAMVQLVTSAKVQIFAAAMVQLFATALYSSYAAHNILMSTMTYNFKALSILLYFNRITVLAYILIKFTLKA